MSRINRNTSGGKAVSGGALAPRSRRGNTLQADAYWRGGGASSFVATKSLSNEDRKFLSTWPASDWWQAMRDPQLNALIEEALRDHPDLAIA